MERCVASLLLASLLVAGAACEPSAKQAGGEPDAASAATLDSTTHSDPEHGGAGERGQALLPIMQKLGSEMTALSHALMMDDYERVTRSAAAIAEHAPISGEEVERIRATLGPDMAAFEAVDESVHVASVRLHEAARAGRPGSVVDRLGEVQRGCVSCHVQFRERLRTDRGGRQR